MNTSYGGSEATFSDGSRVSAGRQAGLEFMPLSGLEKEIR